MAESKSYDLQGRHLMVLVPAYDGKVPVEFMGAYIETSNLLRRHGVTLSLEARTGCALVTKARNELAHSALKKPDVTDLLYIDSDIAWRPDDVMRLLSWASDYPIVAGMYPVKQDEPKFHVIMDTDPETGRIQQNEFGLIKAKGIPAGFMLVRRHALEQIKAEMPIYRPRKGAFEGEVVTIYFDCAVDEETDTYYGEDIEFCRRMTKHGVDIWIDPAIELKHIGTKVYQHDFVAYLKTQAINKDEVAAADAARLDSAA